MAERVGFEPTVPAKVQQFSRLPDSTTLAPLRERMILTVSGGCFQVGYEKNPAAYAGGYAFLRLALKKSCIRLRHLSARTPDVISMR